MQRILVYSEKHGNPSCRHERKKGTKFMKSSSSPFLFHDTLLVLLFLGGNLPALQSSSPAAGVSSTSFASDPAFAQDFGQLPLYFVENDGQTDSQVYFYVQGKEKTQYFSSDGVTFALTDAGLQTSNDEYLTTDSHFAKPILRNQTSDFRHRRWVVKLDFVSANPNVRPVGQLRTEAVISYFKGPQNQWHTGLPSFSRIVYPDLWPGIDLVFYGTVNQLKYEFIVQPGADPNQIRLAYRGADISLNAEGQMLVTTPIGGFKDDTPVAYQDINGRHVPVSVAYAQIDTPNHSSATQQSTDSHQQSYAFTLGPYDPNYLLILDPAVIVYCGYIGGNGQDGGLGISVDNAGNAYIVGSTFSDEASFPVTAGPDLTYNGGNYDAFVAKVNATGSDLVYAGYIGGNGDDEGEDIAVDGGGNAYITGETASMEATFPITIGPDLTHNGGEFDAFVAKVNATGSSLVYAGYIGGNDLDMGNGITVDSSGSAYVTGWTRSSEASFPVTGGPDLTYNGGNDYGDAFVAKVSAAGTDFVYAGYIGGNGDDYSEGIALDSAGNAYVIGYTDSTEASFPVTFGPDLTYNGGECGTPPNYYICNDAFVAKVNPAGTSLIYSGYIGGDGGDQGTDIAVDSAGNAYVIGNTNSTQTTFPVAGGPDLTYNGNWDAFVAKVNATGSGLVYAGYIGGTGFDFGLGIALDGEGNVYVTGYTNSTEATFPAKSGPDLTYNGGTEDAFVVMVSATGSDLVYAGYIGGNGVESGTNITVDGMGNAYITGWTTSDEASFPVTVGPDLTINGIKNAFVAKVGAAYFCISGRVADADGNPIPGVNVLADAGLNFTSNASGYYVITIVPTGTYTLTPTLMGYSFSPITRTVSVPPDATGQDFKGKEVTWFIWFPLVLR
jgi:hypothetical protein